MSMVIAHLSDLHVSRYGEHVTSLKTNFRSRASGAAEDWELVEALDDWRIERRVRRRWRIRDQEDGLELRLVDEAGYVQQRRKGNKEEEGRFRLELTELVAERHLTEHARLARSLPPPQKVAELLVQDPTNTNLRFLRAAWRIREANPDWVVVSGDVTDDGIGYDLVEAGLAPFLDKGRLLAIPGNHDVYDSPPLVVPSHERKDVRKKRALWAPFARKLGLLDEDPWVRELGEGAALFGLDSCTPAWTPLSASGEVVSEAMIGLEELISQVDAPCRLAMVHHHVVNPPILSTGRAPWQLGMRLRNARELYDLVVRHRFACVLNGHRHLGYRYHPPRAPLFVSAPSSTLGDRSGLPPFYWRLEIRRGEVVSVKDCPLQWSEAGP
jgi:3',5'-cyclic-AMP phosphodiesterase